MDQVCSISRDGGAMQAGIFICSLVSVQHPEWNLTQRASNKQLGRKEKSMAL